MTKMSRTCVRCLRRVPVERVRVLPETRLCIQCSHAVGGDFIVYFCRTNLSKAGSLKKIYGDWFLKKIRRCVESLRQ